MDTGKWSKYPEESPEKNGMYVVQYKTGVISFANYDIKKKGFGLLLGDGIWIELANIIAWLPIPEPMECK